MFGNCKPGRKFHYALVGSVSALMLAACASTTSSSYTTADARKCLKADWLAADLKDTSTDDYANFAETCYAVARSDIKPSRANTALMHASQLYYAAAQSSSQPARKATLLNLAARTGSKIPVSDPVYARTETAIVLLQSTYGAQLQLGMMSNAERDCKTQQACLQLGLDRIDQNQGYRVTADALNTKKSKLQSIAGELVFLQAIASAELRRLDGIGSVYIGLERLRTVARRADSFNKPLASRATAEHAKMAQQFAAVELARRDYDEAAEYLNVALQFSKERAGETSTYARLQNAIGTALFLHGDQLNKPAQIAKVDGYCVAAKAFKAATSAVDSKIRAEAYRGLGLVHGRIAQISPNGCGATLQSALTAYEQADQIDGSSKLARAHIEMFSRLLTQFNRPQESLALNQRRGGISDIDAIYQVVAKTPAPTSSGTITKPMRPPMVTRPLTDGNTTAQNYMMRARSNRQIGQFSSAISNYRSAVNADPNWPQPSLELGELLSSRKLYDDATSSLTKAGEIARRNLQKYSEDYAEAGFLLGRNELQKYRADLVPDMAFALSSSLQGASNSTDRMYKRQACLAQLMSAPISNASTQLCSFSPSDAEDELYSGFGKMRQMQLARRALDQGKPSKAKEQTYLSSADNVEASFQRLLGRSNIDRKVEFPISTAQFTIRQFAEMGIYIGEVCQNDKSDLPSVANDKDMMTLFRRLNLDTCGAR